MRQEMLEEMLDNEALMNDVDELDDFEVNEEIVYLVCALGYDAKDDCAGCEVYLKEFGDPDEAIAYAKTVDLETVLQVAAGQEQDISEAAYFSLEVETVVECEDPEDGTENIDTVYQRELWVDGAYGSEENVNHFIPLADGEYEILEDNTVKVPCKLLKDFNKNDLVRIYFPDTPGIDCQIVSKVVCEDGDYYHCEMMF